MMYISLRAWTQCNVSPQNSSPLFPVSLTLSSLFLSPPLLINPFFRHLLLITPFPSAFLSIFLTLLPTCEIREFFATAATLTMCLHG